MATVLEQPEIDFLMLADRAEAINGKLYLMGGAWDQLGVVDFSQPVVIGIAIGIVVPWMATNEEYRLKVFVEHEDGTLIPPEIDGGFTAGRPPQAIRGQSFRAIITVAGQWKLPGPGTYRVVSRLSTGAVKRVTFYAQQAPGLTPALPKSE